MSDHTTRSGGIGYLPVLPPRFALVELALFAIVVGCELWFDGFPDLTRLNPHPYWIAVLLLSLQYGTVSGLLAAALAIGGALLIGLPEAEIGESYFAYLVRVWTQPVLWVIVALLLGSFRMRQIEERHQLLQQADDAMAQAATLSGYARQLKERVDALERRLAAVNRSPERSVVNAIGKLQVAATTARRQAVLVAVMTELGPGAAWSLYTADAHGLVRVIGDGWGVDARWRTHLPFNTPLVRAQYDEPRVMSILQSRDEAVLDGEGQIVIPVLTAQGTLAGILKVESMSAEHLRADLIHNLAVIAPYLAPLLAADTVVSGPAKRDVVVPLLRRTRSASSGPEIGVPSAPPLKPWG